MQKTVLGAASLSPFLIFHLAHTTVTITVCTPSEIVDSASFSQQNVNQMLIPTIDSLLSKHSYTLQDLTAIAVCRGPGQFITLRAMIVTAHALAFAVGIKLVSIDPLIVAARSICTSGYPECWWLQRTHKHELMYARVAYLDTADEPTILTAHHATTIHTFPDILAGEFDRVPPRTKIYWGGNGVSDIADMISPWYHQDTHPNTVPIECLYEYTKQAIATQTFVARIAPLYSRSGLFHVTQ